MPPAYDVALQQATASTVVTEWNDERWDIPSVREEDRQFCARWLQSTSPFPAHVWTAITVSWISFLSATCAKPNAHLAPDRKKVYISNGPKTMQERNQERFHDDRYLRLAIKQAIWALFDQLEALTERWPCQARLLLNQATSPATMDPFRTLAAKPSVRRRRRFNAVWTALICFLVHAADDRGALEEMGLNLCGDTYDDVLSVMEAYAFRVPGTLEDAVGILCRRMIMDPASTRSTNPLHWWLTVLVQSAVDPLLRDDYISRGRFAYNVLPMDIDIRTRVQAVQHYAKVFVLDHALRNGKPHPLRWLMEVGADLDQVDNSWINADTDQRPPDDHDTRTCDSAAWHEMLARLASDSTAYLGGKEATVLGQVRKWLGYNIRQCMAISCFKL